MKRDTKNEMRKRARAGLGLTDLLKDDFIQLRADIHDFDLACLEESLRDAKSTMQLLIDNLTEMEYMVYLCKSKES